MLTRVSAGSVLGATLLLSLGAERGSAQTNTVLTSATCPVCTAAQREAWFAAHDSTVRIRPRDVLGQRIGLNRGERASGSPKYQPILRDKQVACGTFRSFGLFIKDDEWDWNIKLQPTAYTTDMFESLKAATSSSKVDEWPCNGDCFKGEITTDNGFYDNPYFNVDVPYITVNLGFGPISWPDESQARSRFAVGDTLCMYGPWIQDLGHSDHPEIHPSEVIWWRNTADGALYALILQDDSNRFDRPENFRMDDPANWSRPWSAFPRWTDLRVAFLADPRGSRARSDDCR